MADIFIGYASEDRSRVKPLAEALEELGQSVWWDWKKNALPFNNSDSITASYWNCHKGMKKCTAYKNKLLRYGGLRT